MFYNKLLERLNYHKNKKMKLKDISIIITFLVLAMACGGNESPKEDAQNLKTELSEEDKALVEDIMKEEAVLIEPQVTFDQSQLNSKILGLCVKFKALNGANRQDVFNKFETILPSCPVEVVNSNEIEPNIDEAVQVMSMNDLEEMLGEPNEVREDGLLVYYLTKDQSYKVVFMPSASGAIVCRFYEGAS